MRRTRQGDDVRSLDGSLARQESPDDESAGSHLVEDGVGQVLPRDVVLLQNRRPYLLELQWPLGRDSGAQSGPFRSLDLHVLDVNGAGPRGARPREKGVAKKVEAYPCDRVVHAIRERWVEKYGDGVPSTRELLA